MRGPVRIVLGRRPPPVRQAFPDALNALISQYRGLSRIDLLTTLLVAGCEIVRRGHKSGADARKHLHAIVDAWADQYAKDPVDQAAAAELEDLSKPRIVL